MRILQLMGSYFRLSLLLYIFLVSCVITGGAFASDQQTEVYTFKRLTKPEIIAEGKKPKLMPAGFISRRLRMGYPSLKYTGISDRQYLYITDKWFHDVVQWTDYFISSLLPEIDFTNDPPADYPLVFATLASDTANLAVAKHYNLRASVLIGAMRAKSVNQWEAIPGDGAQRIYIVALLQEGGIVYDLQTKQKIGFEQFPNIEHMSAIVF